MPRPDPAVLTTCDRLAARLPHLSTLQLGQVAEHLVNGVDEARGTLALLQQAADAMNGTCDEIEALRTERRALEAAYGAAQQRIAELEGRGLAGHKLGPYVLVPADLLKRADDVRHGYLRHDARRVLEDLAVLIYTEQG